MCTSNHTRGIDKHTDVMIQHICVTLHWSLTRMTWHALSLRPKNVSRQHFKIVWDFVLQEPLASPLRLTHFTFSFCLALGASDQEEWWRAYRAYRQRCAVLRGCDPARFSNLPGGNLSLKCPDQGRFPPGGHLNPGLMAALDGWSNAPATDRGSGSFWMARANKALNLQWMYPYPCTHLLMLAHVTMNE